MEIDGQTLTPLQSEVADRFGVLPNFFCTAGPAPGLIEELWGFAKSAYLDLPLPPLFKERLFVQLSRFCEVRYCIVRHVGFLVGLGQPAGDADAPPESVDEVIALLSRSMPDAGQLAAALDRLRSGDRPSPLPASGTQAEADLFDALSMIFVEPTRSASARDAVRIAFGDATFELLAAYLAFVRTAHFWTETHPELAYEPDMLALMERHGELRDLLLSPADAERAKAGGDLRRVFEDLHQTEAALRDSEERHRMMLQLVPALLWWTDPTGQKIEFSEGWNEYTGQTMADVQNYGWLDAIHPDDMPAARTAFEHAFATGEPLQREQRIYKAGNGYRWHLVRHVPLRDADGTISHWFGAAIDIDDIKLAREALAQSEMLRLVAVAGGRMGTWHWDLDARTCGGDAQFMALWGFPPSDDPRPLSAYTDRMTDVGAAQMEEIVSHAITAGEEFDGPLEIVAGPRAGHWIRWRGRATAGSPRMLHGVTFDITEQKRAEERLRDSEQRLRVLVAELQHRVRNILTVIRLTFARTFSTEGSKEELANHFIGRLDAMARTQVALTRRADRTANLEDLIRDELLSVGVSADGGAVTLAGPEVELNHKITESLAMALHELTTNALKYGALSVRGATLSIGWKLDPGEGNAKALYIDWREQGVPAIAVQPARRGFGRELIEEALPYRLGAETILNFGGGGLRCSIRVPFGAEEPVAAL